MFDVDKNVEAAIKSIISLGGNWHAGKRHIISNGDNFVVSYFDDGKRKNGVNEVPHDNEVFSYSKKSGKFWLSNCGWSTRTTKNLINDCFRALDLPYQVFVSKHRFCIRDIEMNLERVIGDGKVNDNELHELDFAYWKKHV